MQRHSIYIVSIALWMAYASLLYFYGLVTGWPFWLTVVLALAAAVALPLVLLKRMPPAVVLPPAAIRTAAGAAVVIAGAGWFLARKYGDWDAVYIYNFCARFLQHPDQWQQLFLYRDRYSHTDYPLLLPSWVAFFQRLSGGGYKEWVPFVTGLFYTMAIPLLLFLETVRVNKVLATLLLLLIGCNTYYLNNGVIQCADVPLSFFLLLSFLCLDRLQQGGTVWPLLFGMSLGCCLWTKNEGLMYALILLSAGIPALWRHKALWRMAAGLLPFVLTLLLFKYRYAPVNDIVDGQGAGMAAWAGKLQDKERYKLIAAAFTKYISLYFYIPSVAGAVYLFFCVYRQQMPHKHLLVFLAFAIGISVVYLLTPHDLAWHLDNSLSRILLQWYPAFLYVIAVQLGTLMQDGRHKGPPAPHLNK